MDPTDPDDEPITRQLRGLKALQMAELALRRPRVLTAQTGAVYFLEICPHCNEEQYHHCDPLPPDWPAPKLAGQPAQPTLILALAFCEGCGVFSSWRLLGAISDGTSRVMGPEFGAEGPPTVG